MNITKIENIIRQVIPNATNQECYDLIQPILDILTEVQDESLEKYPSLNKWINDSFQMVKELLKEQYCNES